MLFSSGVFCVPFLSVCALEPRKSSPRRAISRLSLTSHLPHQFFHPESCTLTSLLFYNLPSVSSPFRLSACMIFVSDLLSFSPFLLLFCLFNISDPSLSSLLLPCGCSHFLTLPRTRHTQPIDDPQKDPR